MPHRRASLFDWDRYWSDTPPSRDVLRGGMKMAKRVERFIRRRGLAVGSMADVGCGPAVMLFELARSMPEVRLHGFDASEVILRGNRYKVRKGGYTNLRFGHCRLPGPPPGRYDLVTCIATLHYLSRPRQAIRALYGIVKQGGHLIFNYPNRAQRESYRQDALRNPAIEKRFALILAGRNLLTRVAIERTLQARTEDFWSSVGEPTQRANPCVVVAK